MENQPKHIIIVAGEASGDLHAAHLAEELRKQCPGLQLSGLGGLKMKNSGVNIYADLTQIAVVGFIEVLKHYSEFKKYFNLILQKIKETKPDAVILVDYPGFNIRLAKEIKKLNIKVFYYISPQVWAWKENRVKLIKKYIDKMIVLFSFEKEFYAKRGVESEFVGHPLIDSIKIQSSRDQYLNSIGLSSKSLTLGMLPGSRQKEVERHLPVMLESAKLLTKEFAKIQHILIHSPTVDKAYIVKKIIDSKLNIKIIDQSHYEAINACDICLVASGTATLELAILEKPMVIIYKTSFLTWAIAKFFIKIKNIGLVNIIADKELVPECVQFQANPKRITQEIKKIITNEVKIAELKAEFRRVKAYLGECGASRRAAESILRSIR